GVTDTASGVTDAVSDKTDTLYGASVLPRPTRRPTSLAGGPAGGRGQVEGGVREELDLGGVEYNPRLDGRRRRGRRRAEEARGADAEGEAREASHQGEDDQAPVHAARILRRLRRPHQRHM